MLRCGEQSSEDARAEAMLGRALTGQSQQKEEQNEGPCKVTAVPSPLDPRLFGEKKGVLSAPWALALQQSMSQTPSPVPGESDTQSTSITTTH